MSQQQTNTILIILVIAVTFTAITQQQGFAFSDRYSAQQRFSSGYQDGLDMCGDQAQIIQYKHTAEYKGHSDDYHHGFFSGSHNCQAADDVGANNNDGYIGDGNGNQGQSSPMHFSKITVDNQNNRNQNQGQSNSQKSSCIGICYGTGPYSSQNQALGN